MGSGRCDLYAGVPDFTEFSSTDKGKKIKQEQDNAKQPARPETSQNPVFSPTSGSQVYRRYYYLDPRMLDVDKQNPNVYNPASGYFKNPTAYPIDEFMGKHFRNGALYLDDEEPFGGSLPYVLDVHDRIIIGQRYNPIDGSDKAPHPTLIGGLNPPVRCAGLIYFYMGLIIGYDNASGHYKPNSKSLLQVGRAIKKLMDSHPEMFSDAYSGVLGSDQSKILIKKIRKANKRKGKTNA
ncbi:MAG: hypothetical protein LUE27_00970 [Clostridia bacterium]|nr:hypothetical protein [Clostridia bacterium]